MSAHMMASNDDDDDVLDLSEQYNRPADVKIQQQQIEGWNPILDPEWVIYTFLVLAVVFIPTGYKMHKMSEDVGELKVYYDGALKQVDHCAINVSYNARHECILELEAKQYMEPPILVYYELTNFHQNHRSYASSRDDFQLTGQVGGQAQVEADACHPLNKLGNMTLNPCGMIANTFFNDKIELISGVEAGTPDTPIVMIEEGIAWESDLTHRFAQPDGFKQRKCLNQNVTGNCCQELNLNCKEPALSKQDGLWYAYEYPEDDTTQYLYETYPDVINPLEGVTNEHFVVWMRVATRPTFRKLYGFIEQPIAAGTKLQFSVLNNYVVDAFGGSKALIVTTNTIFGGKNPELGRTFYIVGFFCLACGIVFAAKHWFKPRKLASRKYLHYKTD